MGFLSVSNISKQLRHLQLLDDVSFTQSQFQKIAIAGETGSGKTTLMKIIAGLEQADSGEVYFNDLRVKGIHEKLMPGHPGIAYLSQQFELRNHYRVEELMEYANELTDDEAAKIFDVCRIAHLLQRKTDQLSGGEKQRTALARLLITSPKLLLLDEPFSNLDLIHKNVLKSVIKDVGEQLAITCMLISHDAADILSWADEVLVMKDGRLVQQAAPKNIYNQPADAYVAGLFGKYNELNLSTMAALAALGQILDPQKTYIRPEQFTLRATAGGVACVVKHIAYYGRYYDVEVAVSGQFITAQMQHIDFEVGQEVYISYRSK